LFEGRRIRCQIVSVPGQASLASRRRRLLSTADVVVFVCDTTQGAVTQARSYLHGTRTALTSRAGPTAGIVLQANKRDHADALPLPELRAALGATDEKVAIVESVATDGSGIREAFVFAVRLALDRVRELMTIEPLQVGSRRALRATAHQVAVQRGSRIVGAHSAASKLARRHDLATCRRPPDAASA
jgi:ADP-ribosylation factor family